MNHQELFDTLVADLHKELGEQASRVTLYVCRTLAQYAWYSVPRDTLRISVVIDIGGSDRCENVESDNARKAVDKFRRVLIPYCKSRLGIPIVAECDPILMGM